MAAGVIGELWDMDRLFDAVTQHAERQERAARGWPTGGKK